MHICLLHSYNCNTIWNAFLRDAIWLGSHSKKIYLNDKTAGNIQFTRLHAAKWTCRNHRFRPIQQDQSTTFITLRGGGRVVAIRGSAEAQRLPNIIIQSLALAYLLSTLNLFTHTSVFGEKITYRTWSSLNRTICLSYIFWKDWHCPLATHATLFQHIMTWVMCVDEQRMAWSAI